MDFLDLREPVSACSHGAGLLLAVPGTLILWKRSDGDRAKQMSLLVFGMSLALCYAGSALYHAVQVAGERLLVFHVIDHIGILVLIAGTYTPIAWNLLRGRWRGATLLLIWLLAAAGAMLHLACHTLPSWVPTAIYLGMGWGSIFVYGEIARRMSHRTLQPILAGGVLYSVGAAANLLGWPVLWPGVFGAHELFHVFVMGGSLAHFWFMIKVVLPASTLPASPALASIPAAASGRPAFHLPHFRTCGDADLSS
jgi:hemolysin III